MTKEQEAIKNIKICIHDYISESVDEYGYTIYKISEEEQEFFENIETLLNMLKEKDKEIEMLQENVDYQVLCDFLISSVSAEEKPVWTEKHIEELLENFEVSWKDAYKQNS